jgi:hypothetical protein
MNFGRLRTTLFRLIGYGAALTSLLNLNLMFGLARLVYCPSVRLVNSPHRIWRRNRNEFEPMKPIKSDVNEKICPACNGTGVEQVKQPAAGRRIFPPKCKMCTGKGRVRATTN